MARQDPLRGFRFLVEIEGITSAGFTRVKGLSREIKHESYREGGVNEYEHKLFTSVQNPMVILERGLILDDLWRWALAAAEGKIERKTLRIRLQNEAGEKTWAWEIQYAFPVKWSATDLDAQQNQVVMESLELAHHGLRRAS
ncbi:MAG TPA: phage tail protein [Thermoanaerobaculia bacterium]|nr:phage tail protein [Thermoanaerobaculia bacterium]